MGVGEALINLFTGKHKYAVIIGLMIFIIFGLIVFSSILMGALVLTMF